MEISFVKTAIHTVSSALEIPAIIVLIAVMVIVVFELGTLCVEFFKDRARGRLSATRILAQLAAAERKDYAGILEKSSFLKEQKAAFAGLLANEDLDSDERRLYATQIVTDEEKRLDKRVSVTDVIARIAPMFGLMATLIPLGPGLISLGQGDTKGLADSLLTAFDATVAGLVSAGVAFIISKIRKRWYFADVSAMETVLEEVIR
ncbi:MAG: MotA/TolQ/ExbB proton channel family protein [Clostridiales Family XIII bacterium]|nr:MotA/TolQ/ExbB proton channel family protein [Clostridiales Family XIII bacterium]